MQSPLKLLSLHTITCTLRPTLSDEIESFGKPIAPELAKTPMSLTTQAPKKPASVKNDTWLIPGGHAVVPSCCTFADETWSLPTRASLRKRTAAVRRRQAA